MPIETWDDFTSKYGFSDGETVEQRDLQARKRLVRQLNQLPEFKELRSVEYDRRGVHNPCLVIILPNPNGKGDEELLADWRSRKIEDCDLPDGDYDIYELVCEAYEEGDLVNQDQTDSTAHRQEHNRKKIREVIAELINHGLSDAEIAGGLLQIGGFAHLQLGYLANTTDLVGIIRDLMVTPSEEGAPSR